MSRILHSETNVLFSRVRALNLYVKKSKNVGAYLEVEEVHSPNPVQNRYNVKVHQDETRVDRLGNRYLKNKST